MGEGDPLIYSLVEGSKKPMETNIMLSWKGELGNGLRKMV